MSCPGVLLNPKSDWAVMTMPMVTGRGRGCPPPEQGVMLAVPTG